MAKKKYECLFTPGKIGNVELKNRIAMAPMGSGHAGSDRALTYVGIDYYKERAKGGAGMVILEGEMLGTDVDPFPITFKPPCIDGMSKLPKLTEFADALKAYNCVPCVQLSIGVGNQADDPTLATPVSASEIPCTNNPSVMARALTKDDIKKLISIMRRAARVCQDAGVEIIEVHGHGGYLLDQFMSPETNHRTDEYGGSRENRFRLAKELLENIKDETGNKIPVTFRISVDAKAAGARDLQEGLELCKLAEAAGYDGIHVDAGRYDAIDWIFPPAYLGQGCMADLAEAVKKTVSIPVIAVGNLGDPAVANQMIADGKADFIALGRTMLADPEWAKKARRGADEKIRPCIQCNERCVERMFVGKEITCSVNPQAGREARLKIIPVTKPKKVAVIGGGPGGIEAAMILDARGHKVTLFEKSDKLGGQLKYAGYESFKFGIKRYTRFIQQELDDTDVDVRLNTEVTIDSIKEFAPDAVVLATGADLFVPPVPGLDDERVITMDQFIEEGADPGKKYIVAGGGLVGCETAVGLRENGVEDVTLIEMKPELAEDLMFINRAALLGLLDEYGVKVFKSTTIKCLDGDKLICEDADGAQVAFDFDKIIAATGTKSNNSLLEELEDNFDEVYTVGDCERTAKVGEAVHRGFYVGMEV